MREPASGRPFMCRFLALSRSISLIAGIILVTCFGITPVTADDTNVTKVSAETENAVVFQISVAKTKFRRGEDLTVNYAVTNKGDRTIHLITDPTFTDIRVTDTRILNVLDPVVPPDPHEHFNYEFIKILPKATYKGKLLIPAKVMLSDKHYAFEDAGIRIEFAYMFDVSKLGGCKQAAYTPPCLAEVYDKSKTVTLGTLVVQIPE